MQALSIFDKARKHGHGTNMGQPKPQIGSAANGSEDESKDDPNSKSQKMDMCRAGRTYFSKVSGHILKCRRHKI